MGKRNRRLRELISGLNHPSWLERIHACRDLGELGDPRGVGRLIDMEFDPHAGVRVEAERALEKLKQRRLARILAGFWLARDKCWVVLMARRLRSPVPLIRICSCRVLGRFRYKKAGWDLISRLADEDLRVRRAACAALDRLGMHRLAQAVTGTLEGVEEAREDLLRLREDRFGDTGSWGALGWRVVVDVLAGKFQAEHRPAIEELKRRGDAGALAPLLEKLGDPDELVRAAAHAALASIGPVVVEALIARLRDPDEQARHWAARTLAMIGAPAIEPLIALLRDPDEDLRSWVLEALKLIGFPAVEALLARLEAPEDEARGSALDALRKMPYLAAWALLKKLKSGEERERSAAARALREIGVPLVKPLIDDAKRFEDEDYRRKFAEAMAFIGPPALQTLVGMLAGGSRYVAVEALACIGAPALEPLIARLGDPDEDARKWACIALVRIGAPAIEALIARLGGPDQQAGHWAQRALAVIGVPAIEALMARLGDPSLGGAAAATLALIGAPAVEALVARLGEPDEAAAGRVQGALIRVGAPAIEPLILGLGDPGLRSRAAWALARIGDAAIEPLIARLGDPDESVREWVRLTLAEIGAPAVEPLIAQLGHPERNVRRSAALALGKIGDPAVDALIAKLDDSDKAVRAMAVEALISVGAPAVKPLLQALGNPRLRALACLTLGHLGDQTARKPLVHWLKDPSAHVRRAACSALGDLGDRHAVKPLIDRLDDPDALVRAWTCEALGKLGDPEAVTPLLERLRDYYEDVRVKACEALGKLGDRKAVEPLIDRFGDRDENVRRAAVEALEKLGEGRMAGAAIGALEGKQAAFDALRELAAAGDLRLVRPFLQLLSVPDAGSRARDAAEKVFGEVYRAGELLCHLDLARFERKGAGKEFWFACRVCGGHDNVLAGIDEVIAVLDEGWEEEVARDGSVLRVNWLKRGGLFDFDRVEILRASEYQVERLCIVVGNDTDLWRQERYKKVPCLVMGPCEDVLHNLRRTFGEVRQMD